ncbi:capsule assembly Wzi family protein [Amylibacter sp.]|nr:capsule assembly Wzi family protein [Amylibacter sp.]
MILKHKIFILQLMVVIFSIKPHALAAENSQYSLAHSFMSQNTLSPEGGKYHASKNIINLNANYDLSNFYSNVSFTIYKKNKISFDGTNFSIKRRNVNFGVGKINRHWSFSPFTSLILSDNARPAYSVYLTLNGSPPQLFTFIGSWSFEIFNSKLKNASGPQDTMMLGTRLVFNPINQFKIELIRTSQWGGKGFNRNFSNLISTAISDTNSGSNANVNQMAGFGFSYLPNIVKIPVRFYAQAIGEDEAGGLPSCYMYLTGLEWSSNILGRSTKIGFESIDTRIDETQNGNCGKNTAYNNSIYKYTNYDVVLGAPLDTESKSINVWAKLQIADNIRLKYSVQNLIINDKNLFTHRLSNSREEGWIHGASLSWKKGNIDFSGDLYFNDITLKKLNVSNSVGFGINTSIKF